MTNPIVLRLTLSVLIAAPILPLAARGQSQDTQTESVAEAARRAREQKKASAKPAPVITDDTLKPATPAPAANAPTPASSSEVAPASSSAPASQPAADSSTAPAADNSSVPATQTAPGANAEDADQKAKDAAELASLKQQLADAQKAVDLLQRELALDQDTVYSNPNYTDNPTGTAKLDDLKQQIADKQQVVDDLKARVAALQDSLGSQPPAAPAAPAPPAPPQS